MAKPSVGLKRMMKALVGWMILAAALIGLSRMPESANTWLLHNIETLVGGLHIADPALPVSEDHYGPDIFGGPVPPDVKIINQSDEEIQILRVTFNGRCTAKPNVTSLREGDIARVTFEAGDECGEKLVRVEVQGKRASDLPFDMEFGFKE